MSSISGLPSSNLPPIKSAQSPTKMNGFSTKNDKPISFAPFQNSNGGFEDSTLFKSRSFSDFSTFQKELRTDEKKCVKSVQNFLETLENGSDEENSLENMHLFQGSIPNTSTSYNTFHIPNTSLSGLNLFSRSNSSDSLESSTSQVLERKVGEICLNESNKELFLEQFDEAIGIQQNQLDALSPKKTWTTVALVIAGVVAIAFAALAVIFTPYFAIGFVAGFAALALSAHYNSNFYEEEKKITDLKSQLEEIRALFESEEEEEQKKAEEFREFMNRPVKSEEEPSQFMENLFDDSMEIEHSPKKSFYTPELLVEGWNAYQPVAALQKKISDYQKDRQPPVPDNPPELSRE